MQTVALAVMRLQPLHNGHKILIDTMLRENDLALIGIGSIDKRDDRNPYSFELRQQMARALYGECAKLKLFGLIDINAPSKERWAEFVLSEIERHSLPPPQRYYAGSALDGSWFADRLEIRIVDRISVGRGISATAARESGDTRDVPIEVLKIIKENYVSE
ncbi:MAG: hypothetical protein LBN32_01885 [Helicobacteraceae bacterium]|jgi:hypothetical protein|nr:hypothetical protein [Helicobacteraceae bacterium]